MYLFAKDLAPLTLYFVGIIIFFICLTGKVRYGLFFLVPLFPLQNILEKMYPLPLGDNFDDILLIGMMIGWLVSRGSSKEPLMGKSPLNFLLFILFIYTYVSLWQGSFYLGDPPPINPAEPRLQNWKNYMILPLLFFLTANNLKNKEDFKKLFMIMCWSMLLMNFYNVRQVGDMNTWFSRTKVHGTFVWLGANEVAAFYATYTFILIGVFFFEKNVRRKLFLGFIIFLNLYIDLFMFSRGEYIATVLGFFLIAVIRKRILIVPIILLLVFWQAILPKAVIERLTFSEEEGQLDQSAQIRLNIWQESFVYIKENPVFGLGFNVFSHIGEQRDTHNIFLKTFSEQGIIGLTLLLSILGISFNRGLRLYSRADDKFLKGLGLGFAACVLAVIAGNCFGDRWSHTPLAVFFWVYLGMVERGNNLVDQELAAQANKKETQKVKYGRRG